MTKSLKDKVKRRLSTEYRALFSQSSIDIRRLEEGIKRSLNDVLFADDLHLSEDERKKIINELIDEFAGLGPLEELFKDPAVTEIMINGPKKIYVERAGKVELSSVTFDDDRQIMYLIDKFLSASRRHVDESCPFTEVSIGDGSRVNIVIPPLSLDGPVITIRRFSKEIAKIEDLIKLDTLNKDMADFLIACIKAKVNIIFSGATGAGKTTTLNVLSSYIAEGERVITIEDTAELRLRQEHVIRLQSRQSNIEGKGEVSIKDLFTNSLRMRPKRIVIGEIRGIEILDMFQAICSGHTGSLAILHANSPEDVINRIETMIVTSGLPIGFEAIHRQIAAAINLIVQQEQLQDGSRKITHITQIGGLKGGQVFLEDLFRYEIEEIEADDKLKGRWCTTGVIPAFPHLFKKVGVKLPNELFNKK